MSLIYSRSPFFIQSPTGDSTTVSLYVWNGNSSDVPTSAQYTLTKAHNSSGKATFEVSELIRDYVDQSFNGDYVTEAVWVYISKSVTTGGGGGTVTSDKYLATDGYIDEDFVQYWITNSDNNLKSDEVLMSNDYISVPEDTTAVIPTKDADMAVFYKDGEVKFISKLDNNLVDNVNPIDGWSAENVSITEANIESPIGTRDVSKITENSLNTFHFASKVLTPPASTNLVYTIFLKKGTRTHAYMYFRTYNNNNRYGIAVNLENGTITDTEQSGAPTNVVTDVVSYSDDWYRAKIRMYNVTGSTTLLVGGDDNGVITGGVNNTYQGNGSGYIYVWGAQLEVGDLETPFDLNDSNSSGAINYATSAGQSASTFYARVMKDGGTIIDENCSDDIMEYVSELDIDEAHVIKSDGKVEVISVETLPCNKYENVKLTFVNKFGALQDIHFSAKTTESMSAKGSSYNSINFDYDNLSNNYGSHSVRDFNKNATVRHTLNTDHLHESYSEVFRQLIVSEEVWMEHKGAVKPVNVTTNSLQKKTHANNGLVQFTVSVKESHSLINNIR